MMATAAHGVICDGRIDQALELCRRLLRHESNDERTQTALLVLERLRSHGDDTAEHVNSLLRLLANHVSPTRAFTEEMLSLLFFCEHRVVIIHHMSKLTYQSAECVHLVVEAYLELLSSDRSLLVPILGSLADIPLDAKDKIAVLTATQSLLDAAVEDDVPAVVQSLLTMVTPATGSQVASKIRAECNRIGSGILKLVLEVIGRFATAGSVVLSALLRVVRQSEPLTKFDVIFLTQLMGKTRENEIAIRAATAVAQNGRMHVSVLHEALVVLTQPEWKTMLPSLLRFASFLIAVCFQDRTKATLAPDLVAMAVDCLMRLVETQSAVQEEALSLLLTLTSQPRKLVLQATVSSNGSAQRQYEALSWMVAQVVADRFVSLSSAHPKTLKPFAHLFLDHLHGIVSSANDPAGDGSECYPPLILDRLCCTMAALAERDRGIYSLLMITIQKQLISHVALAGITGNTHGSGIQFRQRQGNSHIKQLMAVFLSGHLLHYEAVELADRKSLINWMLRLVSTAASEETLRHVLNLVRRGMVSSSTEKGFLATSDTSEEYELWRSHLAHVLRKKGFVWMSRGDIDGDEATGLVVICGDGSDRALNVSVLVEKMRFSIIAGAIKESVLEQEYIVKIELTRELFNSFLAATPSPEHETIINSGFIVLKACDDILNGSSIGSESELNLATMNRFIWTLICALDLAVMSVNISASVDGTMPINQANSKRRQQLWARLHNCFQLHSQLERALVIQHGLLKAAADNTGCEPGMTENEAITMQTRIAIRMAKGLVKCDGSRACASLVGLDLGVLCFVFESQWKRTPGMELSLKHQHELLLVLNRHLRATSELNTDQSVSNSPGYSISSMETVKLMMATSDGRRTLKYLSFRAAELGRWINANVQEVEAAANSDDDGDNDMVPSEDTGTSMMHELVASSLLCLYQLFGYLLEASQSTSFETNDMPRSTKLLELLAKGTAASEVPASHTSEKLSCQEVFYRFLVEQGLAMRVPSLTCTLVNILMRLTYKTRKQTDVGQLCIALLHQPYPWVSNVSFASAATAESACILADASVNDDGLPLLPLNPTVTAPRGARHCSLLHYRCSSMKWRHLAHFVVGSWSLASSITEALGSLAFYIDAMQTLVDAATANNPSTKKKIPDRSDNKSDEEQDFSESEEDRNMDLPVTDGRHLVLASLTNETLAYYFESVWICAIASLFRSTIRIQPCVSKSNAVRDGPFGSIYTTLQVLCKCMNVFIAAEQAGFDLPNKTNMLMLRGGSFLAHSVKSQLKKCVVWRTEEAASDEWASVTYLQTLFQCTQHVVLVMEDVASSFQERVVLKLQQNMNGDSRSARTAQGRWKNNLMAVTYGKKYQKRRSISTSEAKMLPHFCHAIDDLKDYVQDQSNIHQMDINVETTDVDDSDATTYRDPFKPFKFDAMIGFSDTDHLNAWSELGQDDQDGDGVDNEDDTESLGDEDTDDDDFGSNNEDETNRFVASKRKNMSALHDNEALGFTSIVVNFKKHKKQVTKS